MINTIIWNYQVVELNPGCLIILWVVYDIMFPRNHQPTWVESVR